MRLDERAQELVMGMNEVITAYESGRMSIDRLSWGLKSRIAALEPFADQEWVEQLRAIRNQLEIVNAFFIDSGRPSLNEDERRDIDAALGELKIALTAN